ncbi:MAG: flagellar hook capping protein, partial [Lachnospiraceae bacterium]|nr:flagellar hook capping protein [Lachnospiraceae bacterium]
SLEEMQNMTAGMSLQRASGLVGEEVVCKVINKSTGNTEYAQGVVDYVVYENNKAYVSINDSLYSVDDVYQVMDKGYSEAFELSKKFTQAMASLPDEDHLTIDYAEALSVLRETYDAMNSYQKSFIDQGLIEQLEKLEAKMRTLKGE